MLSSHQSVAHDFAVPISAFEYPHSDGFVAPLPKVAAVAEEPEEIVPGITLTEEVLSARLAAARAEAVRQTEVRLRQEFESRDQAKLVAAVAAFDRERSDYFSRVEKEIVQLALAIAGKILHREAQVDPMLVGALVKVALTQLKDGSAVTVRVHPPEAHLWRQHFAADAAQTLRVSVVEDSEIGAKGCILETELGSANFSLDAQLKEVEQGFFDVLAQRP